MAALDDAALQDGEFFEFDLRAKVAAGDHDDIRLVDDGVDVADGFLVLDLGDDLRFAFEGFHGFPQFAHVSGVADKRAGDVVGAAADGEREILVIFFREGG